MAGLAINHFKKIQMPTSKIPEPLVFHSSNLKEKY
jgi:hypothetical protein